MNCLLFLEPQFTVGQVSMCTSQERKRKFKANTRSCLGRSSFKFSLFNVKHCILSSAKQEQFSNLETFFKK